MRSLEETKRIFRLVRPEGAALVAFIRSAWDALADDVVEEFKVEGIENCKDFEREIMSANNVRFLVKRNDGRIFAAFWSESVQLDDGEKPFRALGCVVRSKGMNWVDKLLAANVSSAALDWFMETEPRFVTSVVVGIPSRFERLNRHAEDICRVDFVKRVVADDGVEYNLYKRDRRKPC